MIQRLEFQYHPDGHPVLSFKQIDTYAETLLKAHFPQQLRGASPLSSAALLSWVNEADGVTSVVADLGFESGRKRLGRMFLSRKIIVLDSCLFTERQVSLPFVIAHEVAHWLLHRDCRIASIKSQECFPDDDEQAENSSDSHTAWTSLQRIEWQASKLAASLLIPSHAAKIAILAVQEELCIPVRKGIIYENAYIEGKLLADQQVDRVAKIFGVSKMVTRIRLKDAKLYHEQLPGSYRPDRIADNPFRAASEILRPHR